MTHAEHAAPTRPQRFTRAAITAAAMAAFASVLGSGVIQCPFARLTHQPCPGCGSTRSVRALLSFDFATAFRFNPAAPVVAACIGVIALEGLWLVARDGNAGQLAARAPGKWAVRILVVAVVAEFFVWGLRFFGLFGGPVPV